MTCEALVTYSEDPTPREGHKDRSSRILRLADKGLKIVSPRRAVTVARAKQRVQESIIIIIIIMRDRGLVRGAGR